ncbi:glycosyltransferase [Chryseobacterium sp. Hurlbut01]|uniref:glycosyltransferase n=1 Tax=Chryseobacterium sp. Hurlbut01 TaxID=1681828 RepID=UPI00067C0BFE|nr:glycosyltransferase [Chryseobacterium sp. Hurlbut01]KNB61247.1 hypothetical protein AC804_11820 [Chryseobacterium sp. Hurlbut01]
MKLLSIVIPIYNVELYLEKCLESITSQINSYNDQEIEVILVNDGSLDNSKNIAKKYSEKFDYITLISQENKGLSEARNHGLEISKGKYVWFLDSDDWIAEQSLNNILEIIKKDQVEVIIVGLGEYKNGQLIKEFIPGNNQNGMNVLRDQNYFVGAVVYVMNISFLKKNKLKFYKGIYHEDEEFTNRMLYLAKNIESINKLIYCVNVREGSITRSSNPKKSFDLLIVISQLHLFMQNVEEKDIYYNRIGLLFNNALNNLKSATKQDKKRFDEQYSNNFNFIKKYLIKSDKLTYKIEGWLLSCTFVKPTLMYNILSYFK